MLSLGLNDRFGHEGPRLTGVVTTFLNFEQNKTKQKTPSAAVQPCGFPLMAWSTHVYLIK